MQSLGTPLETTLSVVKPLINMVHDSSFRVPFQNVDECVRRDRSIHYEMAIC